jgi:hypothetical protein
MFGSLTVMNSSRILMLWLLSYLLMIPLYTMMSFMASNRIPWLALFLFEFFVGSVFVRMFDRTSLIFWIFDSSVGGYKYCRIYRHLTCIQGCGISL